jgi:hypothetical protein
VPARTTGSGVLDVTNTATLINPPSFTGLIALVRNSAPVGGVWNITSGFRPPSGSSFVPVSDLVMLWRNLGSSTFDALVSAQFAKPPG